MVLLSDAGIRDCPSRPPRKLQGTGFLLLHRDTRELLAAAPFFSRHQHVGADDCANGHRRGGGGHKDLHKRIHAFRAPDPQDESLRQLENRFAGVTDPRLRRLVSSDQWRVAQGAARNAIVH